MIDNTVLDHILGHNDKLPTLPGIALKILEAVQKERPDLKEIGEILATDPPLSAEVLRLINSSLYALPRKVTSVFHAVNMLGLNTVKNLALSFALIKQTRGKEDEQFDYPQFWKSSLTAAVSARLIAQEVAPKVSEDAFFIGLLHDMGMLTLARCMPDQYGLIVGETARDACPRQDAESQILGFDHMAVGRYLLGSWGLPAHFCLPVSCHHDPKKFETSDAEALKMSRILHLATLYMELFLGDQQNPNLGLIDHFSREYGFDQRLDVDDVGTRILDQTRQIFPFFELTLKNEADYLEIVDRARAELIHVSSNFIDQLLEQQQQIQQLRRQATHDGLTQLMNYQFFHETLGREMARSQRGNTPLTVIMADIDRFKAVNDTYGHLAGDQALKTVAEHLKTSLRETDCIARYGGEEFAMVLFNTQPDDALVVADRVRETLSDVPIQFGGQTFHITMSLGIATMYPDDAISREELIDQADKALYRAKSAGRNCCRIFHSAPTGIAMAS
jgi:two-component system cell cycle response regulator